MNWLPLAGIFVIASAMHTVFIKSAGSSISPAYAMLISNTIVFVGSIVFFSFAKINGMDMTVSKPGIFWIMAAGLAVLVFEICFLYIFYMEAPMATATTIMRLGALTLTILVAFLAFKEAMTPSKIAGIILAFTSIYLLSKK